MFGHPVRIAVLCCILSLSICSANPLFADQSVIMAQQISEHISTQEWLGPVGAIALSPFFGLACLTGLATYGPESLQTHSGLLAETGPMNNPYLFWTMLVLTLLTSAPRFTKVSKPLSLLAEKLEASSAILIFISMRFFSVGSGEIGTVDSVVLTAGLGSWSVDVMMSLAAAVNLIVINTVKLGIEFLVWLVPIPLVDSVFEVINKSLCASFALLYAYSPTLSLIVNACLFALCALVFLKVLRLLNYYKKLYIFPVIRRFIAPGETLPSSFPGFTTVKWNGIPAKSEVTIRRQGNEGVVEVFYDTWLSSVKIGSGISRLLRAGVFVDEIELRWVEFDTQKNKFSENPLHIVVRTGAFETLDQIQTASVSTTAQTI